MDANLMHISYESGALEDPAAHAPDVFKMTVSSEPFTPTSSYTRNAAL